MKKGWGVVDGEGGGVYTEMYCAAVLCCGVELCFGAVGAVGGIIEVFFFSEQRFSLAPIDRSWFNLFGSGLKNLDFQRGIRKAGSAV